MIIRPNINKQGQVAGYCAMHEGILRPIVVEAGSYRGCMVAMAEALDHQRAEEYAFFESMSHLTDEATGEGAYGEDLG